MTLPPGLYEDLVTVELAQALAAVDEDLVGRHQLRVAEAPDRIALHLSRVLERALAGVPEKERLEVGLQVAQGLLGRLAELAPANPGDLPTAPLEVLRAVLTRRFDGTPALLPEPLTPVLDTTLLTNAPGEPNLWNQLRSEIASADAINIVMAFVRRSGTGPLLEALRRHCDEGRSLRVLTTTYTGSTELAALQQLEELGAEVRVSYDTATTRLHAKAWVFTRASGFSTAYIGSSNLTQSAQVAGREWNVRVSAARNRDVVDKFAAVFDSYWASGDFVPFDPARFAAEHRRSRSTDDGPDVLLSPVELRPEPFQSRLLELLELSRRRGHTRNLLVSATGTGKTVMAALDYASLRERLPRARLLFIAHREEILKQARATFRYALREPGFGELWVGGARAVVGENVFASVQSLTAGEVDRIAPQHFDVVIVDEFHHAAARSYTRLLEHLRPLELLGLTATPERSDDLPVLHWFDGQIAAELRLWDAVEQQHLAPFLYYGVHDGVDLRGVPWSRATGYDLAALSEVYTSSDAWARVVVHELARRVDVNEMRCLGFCVSVEHARHMARHFAAAGIEARAVWADTPRAEREQALVDLRLGRIRALFSVDLFNEGVDVPVVDTVLMLRPTESPTLFLQQLGRGLRKAPGKGVCTVLDFVGTHRKEFRFDRRYRALLGGTRRDLERQVVQQFPFLPSGCSMHLDRVAEEVVLRSIREAVPSRWPSKVSELLSLRRERGDVNLRTYLEETGLELDDVYDGSRCWSDLLGEAGAAVADAGPQERQLRRALGRLLHVDDEERLRVYQELLVHETAPAAAALPLRRRRLLHMLVAPLVDRALEKDASLQDGVDLLWQHPPVRVELMELLEVLQEQVTHVHAPLALRPEVPLQVHARYSRLEIQAALGTRPTARMLAWQTGAMEVPSERTDLLAFTLDKTGGGFSPTTRYRDYAISRSRVHWESQGVTRELSGTGQRYVHHAALGQAILLFTRVSTDDRAFWFLGPADYVSHVGERPMAIIWQLHHELPGDLFATLAAAV